MKELFAEMSALEISLLLISSTFLASVALLVIISLFHKD